VKVGGSDQLGNITTGYQLITKLTQKEAFGLVTPLLTDEMGSKYGKSTGSKVWLSRNKMSAFDFYQYFVRIHDTEVLKFLKLFTFIPDDEIEKIMSKFLKRTDSRYAQERLAEAVTLLVHGESGLESAKKTTSALYNNDLEAISKMTVEEMQEVFGSAALVTHLYLEPGETTVLDVAIKAKCFDTASQASNVIQAGGFFINYKKVTSPSKLINEEADILANDTSLLRVGKRRYFIIKWR
jgi:tyrosyl-tRNA synthetase